MLFHVYLAIRDDKELHDMLINLANLLHTSMFADITILNTIYSKYKMLI